MLKQNTSLIYFVTSSSLATILQKINYIITVYDLCHRDTPEFPEVRDFNSFHSRERLFQSVLGPAAAILTDSRTLADKITKRYGIDHERLLPMPFSPSPFLKNENSIQTEDVLLKYKLQSGYFFYPAQFWPHKNHIRILEAVLILRKNSIYPTVVFVGGDKGNLTFIHKLIHKHELDNQVKILGFIPPEDMAPLYESCKAVVMPSYFGSTNIPPLEAWMLGKPLIYTSYFQEQSGDAALLVDPNEANDIAEAMKQCFNQQICNDLVEKGYNRLQDINKQRDAAENTLLEILLVFEKKIRCWEDL